MLIKKIISQYRFILGYFGSNSKNFGKYRNKFKLSMDVELLDALIKYCIVPNHRKEIVVVSIVIWKKVLEHF